MTKSFPVLRSLGVGGSSFVLFLVLSCLAPSARATELTDLGAGLSYLRVHAVAESAKGLTAAVRESDFLVLDLRHATSSAEAADLLRTALIAREGKPPAFVLVSPATPPAIAESLTLVANKCITLGIKNSIPTPQVIIEQSADADLHAYEALDSGQPLVSLISGKIGKDRFDEAELMKEFNNGNPNAAPPPPPNPTAKPGVTSKAPATPKPAAPAANGAEPGKAEPPVASNTLSLPAVSLSNLSSVSHAEPLTDRVLQRAVHLHRALVAIKPR